VGQLLGAYVEHLERNGKKRSAQDVRSCVRSHIAAHPLARSGAATVEPEELTELLRPVVASGKKRTAAKLRSLIRAAYALAIASKLDASVGTELASFAIKHNPAAVLPTVKGGGGTPGQTY